MTARPDRAAASGASPSSDGVTLAVLRAYRRLSQKDLARRTGMHHATISQYERGRRAPSETDRRRLLEGLGLPDRAWEAVAGVVEWLDWLQQWHTVGEPDVAEDGGFAADRGRGGMPEPLATVSWQRQANRLAASAGRETQRWVRELLEFLILLRR